MPELFMIRADRMDARMAVGRYAAYDTEPGAAAKVPYRPADTPCPLCHGAMSSARLPTGLVGRVVQRLTSGDFLVQPLPEGAEIYKCIACDVVFCRVPQSCTG